jgi:dTDP-glucose 4,6-dehydratase
VLRDGLLGETYHVGTGTEASVERIADLVLDELDLPESRKTTVPDRPGHDRRYLLDSAKIRRELGWEPLIEFDDGVRETIRWYAENRSWWELLRDRTPVEENRWSTPSPHLIQNAGAGRHRRVGNPGCRRTSSGYGCRTGPSLGRRLQHT